MSKMSDLKIIVDESKGKIIKEDEMKEEPKVVTEQIVAKAPTITPAPVPEKQEKKNIELNAIKSAPMSTVIDLTKYNMPLEAYSITHTDPDGLVSGELLRKFFGVKNFQLANYGRTNGIDVEDVKKLKPRIVFISDYSPKQEELKAILDIPEVDTLVLYDHHQTSLQLYKFLNNYNCNKNIIIDIDMGRCGAKIVYDNVIECFAVQNLQLSNKMSEESADNLEDAIFLVDDYDRWVKDTNNDSDYLESYIMESSMNYIGSKLYEDLLFTADGVKRGIEIGKKLYDIRQQKNQVLYDAFSYEAEFQGLKVKVLEGFGNSENFPDIDKYDAVCLVKHNTRNMANPWTYALYTSKDDVDILSIATKFHGGGHKKACGFASAQRLL